MFFLLQDGPANTTPYMIAGYIVIFGVMLIYLASLAIRHRNLKQDLEVLQELEQQELKKERKQQQAKQQDLKAGRRTP